MVPWCAVKRIVREATEHRWAATIGLMLATAILAGAQPVTTDADIIRMVKAKTPDAEIIALIQSTQPSYKFTDMAALEKAGVSDEVVKAMAARAKGIPPSNAAVSVTIKPSGEESSKEAEASESPVPSHETALPKITEGKFMSDDEFQRAIRGEGKDRRVFLIGVTSSSGNVKTSGITLASPEAYLSDRAAEARNQFIEYSPTYEDRRQALTIVAEAPSGGTLKDGCLTVTRVLLLSDPSGTVRAESYISSPIPQTWRNGFGNSMQCSSLISRFSLDEVQAVRAAAPNGEFFVAVFSGSFNIKTYKIKKKHQSHLF